MAEAKKRVLIISDSVKRKTGYATVARNIIARLQDKFEIAQLGLADIPTPVNYNIHYYSLLKNHTDKCCRRGKVIEYVPKGSNVVQYLKLEKGVPNHENQEPCLRGENESTDNYAYISCYFVIQHFKPDIVMPINDVWGLYNIIHLRNRRCFKFMPYIAIDSECMFPSIAVPTPGVALPPVDAIQTIMNSDYPVVFTNWAQDVLNRTARMITGKDLKKMYTIPHGVDTSIWRPLGPDRRRELRKQFFNIDDGTFLIGSVARNQPRKRLDALFPVMRTLIDNYEKKVGKTFKVYFHCCLEDKLGWPLPWLAQYYGVLDRCIFDKNLKPGEGPEDSGLNEIVNCFDVHVSLTNSEGWHLPALETLAAGVPNILTNYSAHADWGKDAIYLCKVAAYEHEPRTGFIKAIASTTDCAKKISLLASSKKMAEEWSRKGIKLGAKLDWDNVVKQWEDLINEVDISDLEPNRYEDPFVSDPTLQDFSLKYFPKQEEEYVSATQVR